MSIEHLCNETAKRLATVASALLLVLLAACGPGGREVPCGDGVCDASETATGCESDCGCGNGIANPGEACDGADLASGTCMDEVQRGGTLKCNADCTFDVTACTLAGCGNGIVEEGETCDGAELGSRTCSALGYAGGDLGCTADCAYDVTTCCSNTCPTAGDADCVGDTLRECVAAASGCRAWQVTDCASNGDICETTATSATCSCIDRCAAVGDERCEGATIESCMDVGGCLDWQQATACGAGKVCADASTGPVCAPDATAEDCSDPYPLVPGENIVAWTALNADYLTSQPSCNTTALEGPDLVLSYTAPQDGFIRFALDKPASSRQVVVVSSAACGTVTPELACLSDSTPTTLTTELGVEMGKTYYFYIIDTTSGSSPLAHPLIATLDESLCSTLGPAATTLSPPNASSSTELSPIFTAELDYPIDTSAGVITVTGNMGTSLSYDLATGPGEISVINGGKTLVIDPGIVFPAGESVNISWSGLHDATCDVLIAPPTWKVDVTGPPCTPGVNGIVGNTITRVPTGLTSSVTEYFVAADSSATGYVYVGGTSDLYRTPKAGGTTQDVEAAATLTSTQLGYDMIVVGNEIYTLESNTTATSNVLWRLSTDGGATWVKENYMQLPQTPNDDLRAITEYKGRLYMTTDEFSGTEIWSVPTGATTLPQNAVLEGTLTGEYYCDGVAADDFFYYLACSNGDRLIRVDRVTLATELISDSVDINSTKDAVHADDVDGDGRADALYVSSYYGEVNYVCAPGGAGPFYVDVLAVFSTSSSNYGLGFDRVNKVLWMFDDDTRDFVKIQ
jgi:hypothetical protein